MIVNHCWTPGWAAFDDGCMRIPPLLAVSVVLLWALGYPLGAIGVGAMSPFLLLFLRFALSGVLMAAVVAGTRRALPRGRQWGHAVIAGLLTQALQFLGCYLGFQAGVPAGIAALILGVNPAVTAVVARVTLRERLTRRKVAAAGLGLAAVVAACWATVPQLAHAGAGIGFVLLGLAGLAVGGVYQQRFCRDVDPVVGNTVGLLTATVPTGILVLVFGATVTDPVRAAVVLAVMVVLSSMVATTLYLRVIAIAGAGGAAMLFAVIPAVAALLSFLLLGESFRAGAVVGLALGSAACVVAATGRPARSPHPAAAVPPPVSPSPAAGPCR